MRKKSMRKKSTRKKIEFDWEKIHEEGIQTTTYRAMVIGGWLVKYENTFSNACTIEFIPDANHAWKIL